MKLRNILITGDPTYTGAVLVRKCLKAGHTVKAQESYIYRNDIFSFSDKNTISNDNLYTIDGSLGNKEKFRDIAAGYNVIIYFAQTVSEHDSKFDYDAFTSLVDNVKDCGVQRLIYVSSCFINSTLCVEHLKKNALDNLTVIIVNDSEVDSNQSEQKREISVEVISTHATNNHEITLYGKKQKDNFNRWISRGWYASSDVKSEDPFADCKAELFLALSGVPVKKLEEKMWPYIVACKIFLNRSNVYKKISGILSNPIDYFIRRIKFELYSSHSLRCRVRHLFDILVMMFLVHSWPEQAYRFSTRKMLPYKERRYRVSDRPVIPSKLVESRTSDIPGMKEANIVLRGSSFDIKQLDKLVDIPTFLVSFWEPVQAKKEVTYLIGRAEIALRHAKLGHKVIFNEICMMDYDGNITPSGFSHEDQPWYNQFVADGTFKRISILENLYYGLPKSPDCLWSPLSSGIHGIISLSYFAEKINVYGWDYYLGSSPDSMSYWQLYFNLNNQLKEDIKRASYIFETAIVNYYYGYHLSRLPNINIHGYLGQLGHHEKLIGKLERVLFNA